jgi:hypothetical protein
VSDDPRARESVELAAQCGTAHGRAPRLLPIRVAQGALAWWRRSPGATQPCEPAKPGTCGDRGQTQLCPSQGLTSVGRSAPRMPPSPSRAASSTEPPSSTIRPRSSSQVGLQDGEGGQDLSGCARGDLRAEVERDDWAVPYPAGLRCPVARARGWPTEVRWAPEHTTSTPPTTVDMKNSSDPGRSPRSEP